MILDEDRFEEFVAQLNPGRRPVTTEDKAASG
jgi:hypothetical protein